MTFLSLGAGASLALALVTVAALTWLFFLKLRHPSRLVPSLLLWQRALDEQRPRSWRERLRRLLSLALVLAVGLLLALAPARPATTGVGAPASLTVVVDTGPSMAALATGGRSRLDHARERARALVERADPTARLALRDTSGRVDLPAGASRRDVLRAIDALGVGGGQDRPFAALGDGPVYFISDRLSRVAVPAGLTPLSVFEPADNVAIIAFDIRPVPASPRDYQAYLEVGNYAREARTVDVTLGDPAHGGGAWQMTLAPGARSNQVVSADALPPGAVWAAIRTDDDALALDDRAVAYMPSRAPLAVTLVSSGNPPLETVLTLDPSVALSVVEPGSFREVEPADVWVLDRVAPPPGSSRPAMVIDPPDLSWLPGARLAGVVEAPVVTRWGPHDILRDVAGEDLRIDRAARVVLEAEADASVTVVAAAADVALVAAAERPTRRVLLTFDLAASDFAYHLGFPVFVRRTLAWLAAEPPPLRARSGRVRVPWPDAAVTTDAGAAVPVRPALGGTTFEAVEPGLFYASRGAVRVPVVVNLSDPEISDLTDTAAEPVAVPSEPPDGGHEFWRRMLGLALALGVLEWWTFHRRITA